MPEPHIPMFKEMSEWPEFWAFAKRLGIDVANPSRYLKIELGIDIAPEITHRYLGTDEDAPA